ncbi:HDOD domain-containing protein [Desulfocastanea catecholica]
MTQTIVISSGKGGVGKTNISVNAAIELAQRNYRTCLLDADLGLANVNILLGINPENSLDDYIFGDKNLNEIILPTKFGIDVIPGSSGIEKIANLAQQDIADLVAAFAQIRGYDYFLIDTSSGISRGVIAFCLAGSQTIIVITAEATSLTDAYALLKVMACNNYSGTVKILVNKSPSIPQAKETYLRFKDVVSRHLKINMSPAGIILNDPNIETSITRQQPALLLYPDSLACQCIRAMVANLLKSNAGLHQGDDLNGFWQRYFDYALQDLALPELPGSRKTPKRSFQLLSPASAGEGCDQAEEGKKLPENTAESISPFVAGDGIFALADLPIPTPLLAKALTLQAQGKMTEELLLDFFCSDPVLMVMALKLMHGSAAGTDRTGRVTRRQRIIEQLGPEVLTNLLRTTAMHRGLQQAMSVETAKLTTGFWAHSGTCALLAENIAEITGYPYPEEAFIAGLIHDIGRLALQTDYPAVYGQFCENFGHDAPLLEMERRIFTTSHAEIAAKALRSWQLDGFLVDAVQYHAEPWSRIVTAFSLVQIVFLASRLADSPVGEGQAEKLSETLFELSGDQLHNLTANAAVKTRQLADRFDIPLAAEPDDDKRAETDSRFRQQARDYALLQSALPGTPVAKTLPEIIRGLFSACDILLGIQPALCLLPDRRLGVLQGRGYPGCLGWDTLADMQFSLQWEKSLVVQAFLSRELKSVPAEDSDVLSLADQQLFRALGTDGCVCVPMITEGMNHGIIVFGLQKNQRVKIDSLRHRLEQFGAQAAKILCRVAD